ncbi:MAG TPA: coenzyme F420-0:L-glutamate ligase [Candidatus Acidoferrales bacterium]|nr:coenzyme F420-0:L-glutamate ligase [Candidatus Acidoferrales bacterium]
MIQIIGLRKLPLIKQGDDLAEYIVQASRDEGIQLQARDVVVIAQKVVSKAEGRVVKLNSITPSEMALDIAKTSGKDPRHVEAILRETAKIVRRKDAHLIVETKQGFVCANAGVDRSNVEDENSLTLLPTDADRSAKEIREKIRKLTGVEVGVIISDTFGRAWRIGQVNVAVGVDGMPSVIDYRGQKDMFGYILNVTQMAVADELASAAELAMRKSDGIPVVLIRGFNYVPANGSAKDLVRPEAEDLFR